MMKVASDKIASHRCWLIFAFRLDALPCVEDHGIAAVGLFKCPGLVRSGYTPSSTPGLHILRAERDMRVTLFLLESFRMSRCGVRRS